MGALQNTFAVNQIDQFGLGRDQLSYGMVTPTDGYFGMNTTDDCLDFGTAPSQSSMGGDMSLDFNSPIDLSMPLNDFVDPSAINTQTTSQPNATQIHPQRVYPGMHQQAALAKAKAEDARKQQQAATLQQQRQTASSHSRHSSKSGGSGKAPTDPIVEESISRLLNQMRHSSVASSNDDDATTPNANGNQSHTRQKKDEEDMDEDERLLASEEGKKLSSKERRQLRNKVSARAFRSRRKGIVYSSILSKSNANSSVEYIGQLEGELAVKQSEADELRHKNEQLMAENTRLTELTRMLLSSSAFSTFLNDLSGTGGAPASIPDFSGSQQQASSSQPRPNSLPKDVNPNQAMTQSNNANQQNNMYVGMTTIPEENSFNYNTAEYMGTGYTDNMDVGGLYDAQVYAVTSVPEGPAIDSIDFTMLHGKSSNFVGSFSDTEDSKDEPTPIEIMPSSGKLQSPQPINIPEEEDDIDISDPALALFVDQPASLPSSAPRDDVAPEDRIFGEIELEKAFGRLELIIDDDAAQESEELNSAALERFERLCSRLDASSARIAAIVDRS